MYPLVFPAAVAALCLGAQALTLGRQDADPDFARESAAVQETCLRAVGLPDCPGPAQDGGVDSLPSWGRVLPRTVQTGCLDSALLAEDMGELGFSAKGCDTALQMGADVRSGKPDWWPYDTPDAGQVSPANVSHTKPVVWVHIHKSMGTFIYSLAMMSHENVVQPSYNGNWWPYDTPDAVRKGHATHADCSKRSEWFAWSNVTWGQIEHDIDDYNLCHDHFNYGILLRDPSALAISKASMEMYTPGQTIDSMSCLVRGENDDMTDLTRKCDYAAPMKHHWKLWWFYDNFLVRTLGGQSVWSLPAGGITEEHAHNAIERLSKFEVVMFGEDFEDTAHLQATIGWRPEFFDKAFKRPSTHVVEFTDEQNSQARHNNRFDYMVYDHFKSIPIQQRVKKFQ
jgi:hypothetical protein